MWEQWSTEMASYWEGDGCAVFQGSAFGSVHHPGNRMILQAWNKWHPFSRHKLLCLLEVRWLLLCYVRFQKNISSPCHSLPCLLGWLSPVVDIRSLSHPRKPSKMTKCSIFTFPSHCTLNQGIYPFPFHRYRGALYHSHHDVYLQNWEMHSFYVSSMVLSSN